MDRRDFLKITGAAAALAAMPLRAWSALSGLSGNALEAKVKELTAALTMDEKISMMAGVLRNTVAEVFTSGLKPGQGHGYTGYTVGVERLGIPQIKCLDGPRGVGFMYKTTCFPVGMARGATFDVALEEKAGDVMGCETRALGGNMLLAPCINLLWHPRWGRAQETYGEDQHHLGAMGAAFTKGTQKHVMACPKHYAVNNIEDTRMTVDAILDERTLREVFIPHFKKCVDAGAATVMSAYNLVGGTKAGQNKRLCREILKEEWNWDGFVVSDWVTAMDDAALAANGGIDLEMPRAAVYGDKLKAAVESGAVKPEIIDDAVSRLLRQIFRFVGPDFDKGYSQKMIASAEHIAVAREVAEKSMVLLKNEGGVLPFSLSGIKSLAVLGKLGIQENLGDNGSSRVTPPRVVTILDGIKNKARAAGIKVSFCSGLMPRSKMLAEKADAVLVIAGLGAKDEGEGHDREDMTLHPDEIKLIETALAANQKTAVVLIGGSAITMEGWIEKAPAVIMAWYPGMEGGTALANVVFGDVNPSGRLPIVFPKSESDYFKFENKAGKVEYKGFHGYRYFDGKGIEPLFHFGHGLSYTTFEQSNLKLDQASIGKDGKIVATIDVKNTGSKAGEEIVFLFVGAKNPPVSRAKKELKAFTRVALQPGEQKTVTLEVEAKELARFCMQAMAWVVDPGEYRVLAGPSADDKSLLATSLTIDA